MEKEDRSSERGQYDDLANRLDELQKIKNGGRGIGCVETVIFYLRRGDMDKTRAVCWNEADKIVSYPDVRKFIQQELFSGLDEKDIPAHFRASSDRWYGRE